MGLDTWASALPRVRPTKAIIDMFDGEYPEFRGKLWSASVERLTGQSLYQEWIPPETVAGMYESLKRAAACNPSTMQGKYDKEAADDLLAFFAVCADNHLGLVGSW